MPPRKSARKEAEAPKERRDRAGKPKEDPSPQAESIKPKKAEKRKPTEEASRSQLKKAKAEAAPNKGKGRKLLDGIIFVRTGDRINSSVSKLVEAHGGVFEKTSQTLKRNVTHLLDGNGASISRAHLWTMAVKGATERGCPIVVVPADADADLEVDTFMDWVRKAEEVAAAVTKLGASRNDIAKAYRDAFGCEGADVGTDSQNEVYSTIVLRDGKAGAMSLKWSNSLV